MVGALSAALHLYVNGGGRALRVVLPTQRLVPLGPVEILRLGPRADLYY